MKLFIVNKVTLRRNIQHYIRYQHCDNVNLYGMIYMHAHLGRPAVVIAAVHYYLRVFRHTNLNTPSQWAVQYFINHQARYATFTCEDSPGLEALGRIPRVCVIAVKGNGNRKIISDEGNGVLPREQNVPILYSHSNQYMHRVVLILNKTHVLHK